MSSTWYGAFQRREEAAVPRRFGAGALFVLVTIYCLLFRFLTLLGASPPAVLVFAIFFTGISAAQAILFEGRRPRTASCLAGQFIAPAILLLAALDDWTLGLTGMRPAAMGWGTPGRVASMVVVLWFLGRPLGYFVGCATAGVFLITQRWKARRSGQSPHSQVVLVDEELVNAPPNCRSWLANLRPFQPDRPLAGALAMFAWVTAAVLLLAPFTPWPVPLFAVGAGLGVFVAGWTGLLQLPLTFSFVLLALTAGLAAWPGFQMRHIHLSPQLQPWQWLSLFVAAGLFTALTVLALLGWFQWLVSRWRKEKLVFACWSTAVPLACFFVTGTWMVSHSVSQWQQTPLQQACHRVFSTNGQVGFSAFQTPWNIYLGDLATDDDAEFVAQQNVRANYVATWNASRLTNRGLAAVADMPLLMLDLSNTNLTDDGISLWKRIPCKMLQLNRTAITDDGIRQLCKLPGARKLAHLNLSETKVTATGIEHLSALPLLSALGLQNCDLGKDAVQAIAAGCPNVSHLRLNGTKVDDESLQLLDGMQFLVFLDVHDTPVTRAGVAKLLERKPGLDVRYDGG